MPLGRRVTVVHNDCCVATNLGQAGFEHRETVVLIVRGVNEDGIGGVTHRGGCRGSRIDRNGPLDARVHSGQVRTLAVRYQLGVTVPILITESSRSVIDPAVTYW